MIARERSLPTDRLFPFGPGSPRRRFDIFAVAGRARRPLGELTISLRSMRAKACYSLRDANLPPAPGEYARGGVQYDGSWTANAVSASQRGVIWIRDFAFAQAGLRATISYGWRRNARASRVN